MKNIATLAKYRDQVKILNQEVTLFMLTYNREFFLQLAIESVLKQTYSNFQLFILDNCSTDDTSDIIKAIDDPRVLYIKRESVRECTNSQFAFRECITEYLIVLHDDDILDRTYLEEILGKISNSNYAAVSVVGKYIDEKGKPISRRQSRITNESFSGKEYISQFYSKNSVSMVCPSVIYRKKFYNDYKKYIDIFDAGPARDQVVWFQTERYGGQIHIFKKALLNYRIHTNQDSNINLGFLDMQLIDWLNEDPYYRTIVRKLGSGIRLKIWNAFKAVVRRYYKGSLDKERFDSFLKYQYIQEMRKSLLGNILYYKIMVIYTFPKISKKIVKTYEIFRKKLQ